MSRDLMIAQTKRGSLLPLAMALAAGLALAGCQSGGPSAPSFQIDESAGSSTNIDSLTALIQQNPRDASNYNIRGTAYGKAGQNTAALADFNQAIQLNPNLYQAYLNRGVVLRRMGNDGEALNSFNRALQLNPQYADALVARGNLYWSHRATQANVNQLAMNDFSQAIQINSSSARAYYGRGLVYQANNQLDEALQDFNVAITLDANSGEPYNGRGEVHAARNEWNDALKDFISATNRNSKSVIFWTNLGIAQLKTGNKADGRDSLIRATIIDPTYQPAKRALSESGGF